MRGRVDSSDGNTSTALARGQDKHVGRGGINGSAASNNASIHARYWKSASIEERWYLDKQNYCAIVAGGAIMIYLCLGMSDK